MPGLSDASLPTELIEHILDILYQDRDFMGLKFCSQVNDVFRILSQTRILKAISFRTTDRFGQKSYYCSVTHLVDDIARSPQTSSYVQKLVLPYKWVSENDRYCSIPEVHVMEKFLLGLPNLHFLSIPDNQSFRRDSHGLYKWTATLDSPIDATLLNFFKNSTKLTELDLTGTQLFPGVILDHIPFLKRLSLSTIEPPNIDRNNLASATKRLQLKYFRMTYPYSPMPLAALPWLYSPSCPVEFQHLETLKISFIGQEHPRGERLYSLCPDVSHIVVDVMSAPVYTSYNSLNYMLHAYPRDSLLDLKGFKALRHLTIEGVLKIRTFHHRILIDYFETPIPWVADMLRMIFTSSLSATTLTEVTLKLRFIDFPLSLIPHLHNNWTALSSSLRTQNLPNFIRLDLDISGLTPLALTKLKEDTALVDMEKDGRLEYI